MNPSISTLKESLSSQFDRVATRYDLLSTLNPGYRSHLTKSARRLALGSRPRLLDLCCGTGLSTVALAKVYPDAEIVALDNSQGMLDAAAKKRALGRVNFVLGDATDPAAAGAAGPFDGILMAYGIRNVPDADECLGNLLDLLRPGAPIAFHEYSVADSAWSRTVWKSVSDTIIIPLGKVLAKDDEIFRYLRRSVLEFDGKKTFVSRLERAGFERVEIKPMSGWQRGIVHTFLARRPT